MNRWKGIFINSLSHVAVSWKSIEMQISGTRCWRGRAGRRKYSASVSPAIYSTAIWRRWEVGGGRGDDEHLSNERKPAPRATWLYPPPPSSNPHPSMSILRMICLFSKLLPYTSVIQLWNEKVRRTGPSPFLPHPRDLNTLWLLFSTWFACKLLPFSAISKLILQFFMLSKKESDFTPHITHASSSLFSKLLSVLGRFK